MAVDIVMTRMGHHLVAYDAVSAEELDGLGNGPFIVTVKKPRSIKHNRLYFQCLQSMAKAGAATSYEDLHDATKLKCGLVRMAIMPQGEYFAFPDSSSFSKLDQIGFTSYFDKAVAYWKSCKLFDYLPPDLRERLERGER